MTKTKWLDYEELAKALFEDFESVYDVDLSTGEYRCLHESRDYKQLKVALRGQDFFIDLKRKVKEVVAKEDQKYVLGKLTKQALLEGINRRKYYSLVYRLQCDGKKVYHQLRATKMNVNGREHAYIGVRNIDTVLRRELAQRESISSYEAKEGVYMKAIVSNATAYMSANLTKDKLLTISEVLEDKEVGVVIEVPKASTYTEIHSWMVDSLIAQNKDAYNERTSKNSLLKSFWDGEQTIHTQFAIRNNEGVSIPYREEIHLYKEEMAKDIYAFFVLYPLKKPVSCDVYIQTFGRFLIRKNGKPVKLTGKAKEILAYVVTKRGKEVSNEEIYGVVWEGRPYNNKNMTVYYNALRRLKTQLEEEGIRDLLISTSRGQLANTEMFLCDYYQWKDGCPGNVLEFDGEFLPEYTWGERLLAEVQLAEFRTS